MELKDIYELWDRFDKSDAAKMKIEIDGVKFSLDKNNNTQTTIVAEKPVLATSDTATKTTDSSAKKADGNLIKAPLVGTFYTAPSPDAKPFVTVGQEVKKGDVVAIIEAMKLMNEVTSPVDGVVKEVLAKDGELVSYDQELFVVGDNTNV